MKESKSVLIRFDNKLTLLRGIDVLNDRKISISEVYAPEFIPLLARKLRIKELKSGAFILRFRWFGGAVAGTFFYYLIQGSIGGHFNQISSQGLVLSLTITAAIFLFTACFFPSRAPKIRRLRPNDRRYLLVVKCRSIMQQKQLTDLLKYAEGVEVSAGIKNRVIHLASPKNKFYKSI